MLHKTLAHPSVCVGQRVRSSLVLYGYRTPDLMCGVWDHLEKAAHPT